MVDPQGHKTELIPCTPAEIRRPLDPVSKRMRMKGRGIGMFVSALPPQKASGGRNWPRPMRLDLWSSFLHRRVRGQVFAEPRSTSRELLVCMYMRSCLSKIPIWIRMLCRRAVAYRTGGEAQSPGTGGDLVTTCFLYSGLIGGMDGPLRYHPFRVKPPLGKKRPAGLREARGRPAPPGLMFASLGVARGTATHVDRRQSTAGARV